MNKWTPDDWLSSTQAELFEGTEYITSPAAGALIRQSISHPKHTKILDVGCGLGQLTSELQQSEEWKDKWDIVCIDKDETLVEAVKVQIRSQGWEKVSAIKGSAEELSFKDSEFSHVFGSFLYLLLPDPQAGLKESIRVLAPGGTLGLTSWKTSAPLLLFMKALALMPDAPKPPSPPGQFISWTKPEYIRSQLETLPLENIKIEQFDFKIRAKSAKDMARDMRPMVYMVATRWPEDVRDAYSWTIFEKIEEVLNRDHRVCSEGEVELANEAWIVTAQKV